MVKYGLCLQQWGCHLSLCQSCLLLFGAKIYLFSHSSILTINLLMHMWNLYHILDLSYFVLRLQCLIRHPSCWGIEDNLDYRLGIWNHLRLWDCITLTLIISTKLEIISIILQSRTHQYATAKGLYLHHSQSLHFMELGLVIFNYHRVVSSLIPPLA